MFVYFIRAGEYVKIGKAADPEDRMRGMQTACPFHMRLVGTIDCRSDGGAYVYERKLHHRFRSLRVRGEWFRMDREILRYIGRRAKKVEHEMLLEEQLHILMDAKARVAMENDPD